MGGLFLFAVRQLRILFATKLWTIALVLSSFGTSAFSQIKPALTISPDDYRMWAVTLQVAIGKTTIEGWGDCLYNFDLNTLQLRIFDANLTLLYKKTYDSIKFHRIKPRNVIDLSIHELSKYTFDDDDGIEFILFIYTEGRAKTTSFTIRPADAMYGSDERYAVMSEDRSRGKASGLGWYYILDDDGSLILEREIDHSDRRPELTSLGDKTILLLPVSNAETEVYILSGTRHNKESEKLKETSNSTVSETLQTATLEVGVRISLNKVQFDQSSSIIREDAYQELNTLLKILQNSPSMVIRLEGHTDNQGSAKANMKLSEDRVNAIKNYLVKNGIKSKRIQLKAFGQTKPIASNSSEESRKLNRRVEMVILKN